MLLTQRLAAILIYAVLLFSTPRIFSDEHCGFKEKKIIIFGAGYVGTITGAYFAKCGHHVTFIDPDLDKVEAINQIKCPFLEPKLQELIRQGADHGILQAKKAIGDKDILEADIAMIAVATPSNSEGVLQLSVLRNVLITIREAAVKRDCPLIIAIRSTITPPSLRQLMKECYYEKNPNLTLVVNPEFLRESTAVDDLFHPPFCIAGGDDINAVNIVLDLYEGIGSKRFAMSLETACLLKYACNAFHALKITFANEIASLCESLGANPVELMEVFCEDQKLNCSPAYLKPGFSFGGSCLSKDLRAFVSLGSSQKETLPLLNAILPSNRNRFQKIAQLIIDGNHKKLALLGMSFKKNSDDLRESPYLELIDILLKKRINVQIFDPDVQPELLTGANLELFNQRSNQFLPIIKRDLKSALEGCDGVVLCKELLDKQNYNRLKNEKVKIYDLHYLMMQKNTLPGQ